MVDGSGICRMTSTFFNLFESIGMVSGHFIKGRQDTDAGLVLPSAFPDALSSLCVCVSWRRAAAVIRAQRQG